MSGVAPEILVVEDDSELRQDVADYLRDSCFVVREAGDAASMDRCLCERSVDLVILDLGLPGEGGLSICRRLSAVAGAPAIIIATAASDEMDRVVGLELGADDYLPKPYSPRELLARVKAVLRRRFAPEQGAAAPRYKAAGLLIEPERRRLTSASGETVLLSEGEASLLDTMLRNAGRIVPREELRRRRKHGSGREIDLQVSRLRRKLAEHGAPDLIKTHRGLGYVVDCQVARQ